MLSPEMVSILWKQWWMQSRMPQSQRMSQLRTFPSMLNYYHCFLPDVATVLEPPVPSLKEGGEVKVAEGKAHSF